MFARQYALSKLPGRVVSIATAAERRALIGKKVAFDLRGSSRMHRGVVTDAKGRNIAIDGNWRYLSEFEQMSVLAEGEE